MKFQGLLFILPVLLQAASAQQPGAVEGIVVDAIADQPLSRVTVQLRKYGNPPYLLAGETGADGTFVFRNVPSGEYQIEALHGGYIPGIYGDRPAELAPALQTIAPGQVLSGIRIALTPGGVIFGRLTDDRGEAVAGATVEVLKATFNDGERQRTVAQTVSTNDLGDYRFFMLTPGEYFVRARLPSSPLETLSARSRSVSVYFPGTVDTKEARRIDLNPGEIAGGIDLLPFPTRMRRVTGNVVGLDGDPAVVVLSPLNETQGVERVVDPQTGAFEFKDVVPGSYSLVARSSTRWSAIPLEVRNVDVLNYSVPLGRGYEVPVRVRIKGHPPGDDPELDKLYFVLQPDSPIAGIPVQTYSPFPNGRFTFTMVPGLYRVHLTRPEDSYIQSMSLAGVDVVAQGLQVEGSSDVPLEIVVGTNPGSVEGRATGNRVTVVLVPNPGRRGQSDFYRSAKAETSGEFRLERVPPGDYKLFAWQAENGGPWRDPETIARYEARGVPVRVEEGARVRVSEVIPHLD